MVKQLRKRFMLVYMLTTGLLLAVIMAGLFAVSQRQYEEANIRRYRLAFEAVVEEFQSGSTVSFSGMAQSEVRNNLIIQISFRQIPLSFQGGWTPPTDREWLIEKLNKCLLQDGFRDQAARLMQGRLESAVYSVRGKSGDFYYGSTFIKKEFGGEREILVLKALADETRAFRQQLALYCLVGVLGLFVLFLLCRCLVGRMLGPLESGLKRQRDFIAAASHELRAPLTVIRSGLRAISIEFHSMGQDPAGSRREGMPSDTRGEGEEFLPVLEREAERMTRLIDDMLLLASADAKSWTLHKETMELDTFLISVYDMMAGLCARKKQVLSLHLPERELPRFCGDRQRMEQLLMALVDNACAYSPEGAQIGVTLWTDGRRIRIEVEDHGRGIPDEEKERIFERFYRSDQSRNDKQHYGLGLSIASELAALHQGKLAVRDTEGGGSTFVMEFMPHK